MSGRKTYARQKYAKPQDESLWRVMKGAAQRHFVVVFQNNRMLNVALVSAKKYSNTIYVINTNLTFMSSPIFRQNTPSLVNTPLSNSGCYYHKYINHIYYTIVDEDIYCEFAV